jgi:general secretion pathway protein E
MAEAGRPMAPGEKPTFYRAVGCNQCFGTGYRGRVGLFEFLEMTPEVGNLVMQGVSVDDIRGLAKAKGMQTMRQDGLWKVAEGETSLEEVIWVVG